MSKEKTHIQLLIEKFFDAGRNILILQNNGIGVSVDHSIDWSGEIRQKLASG